MSLCKAMSHFLQHYCCCCFQTRNDMYQQRLDALEQRVDRLEQTNTAPLCFDAQPLVTEEECEVTMHHVQNFEVNKDPSWEWVVDDLDISDLQES